jgi:hypothetical protein
MMKHVFIVQTRAISIITSVSLIPLMCPNSTYVKENIRIKIEIETIIKYKHKNSNSN